MFLNDPHDFMTICFCETLERRLADDVAEVNMILAVFRIAQLVDEKLDGIRSRTDETETAQVSHFLSRGIIESVREVDFMVEQSGLGDGGRYDRNLQQHLLAFIPHPN